MHHYFEKQLFYIILIAIKLWIVSRFFSKLLLFHRLSELSLSTALPHYRLRGSCWADIRLSNHPELSGHAVHGEVGGLDIGGQHGRRFVLLRHTHKPQKGPYTPFVQTGAETSDGTCAEAVKVGSKLFLGGPFQEGGCRCRGWKCGVCSGVRPNTPHSTGDPPSALHVCYCCQRSWWVAVRRIQMGVSICGAVQQHPMDRWVLSGADVQDPRHSVLETVWLLCDEAQQVGCLRE